MPVIYQTLYEKHYRAPCCSCVAFTTAVVYIMTCLLVFLFVFETHGLWKEEQWYYEQAKVALKNEFLLEVMDEDGISSQYSTVKSINDKLMNPRSPPFIQVFKDDMNGD